MNILRAAAIDGRTRNIRYRQNELQNLHSALLGSLEEIQDALAQESITGNAELVEREFYLAMDSIRQFYNTLNFDQSLKEEYSVKDGGDNTTRSIGYGLAVLRPARHSRFYSVVNPLAAAIASGNCTLIEVCPIFSFLKTLHEVPNPSIA